MKPNGTSPRAPHERTRAIKGLALLGLAALLPAGQTFAAGKFTCSIADPGIVKTTEPVTFTGSVSGGKSPYTVDWTFSNADPGMVTTHSVPPGSTSADTTFGAYGPQAVTMEATESGKGKPKTCTATRAVTVEPLGGTPTARGDTYATPVGKTLVVQLSRVSGVLWNDFDTDPVTGEPSGNTGLTAVLVSGPTAGTLNKSPGQAFDGSFEYTPDGSQGDNDDDEFTYKAVDGDGHESNEATVNIHITADQPDFKIMMNYELGMHCTGFEFSYCCVLPPYNSIVAQVLRPQSDQNPFPRLLTGDPNSGLDALDRETVLRDYDSDGTIHKYFLKYEHDAQPRHEGNSPGVQTSTLISAVEGNSLLYWNTPYDSAMVDSNGRLVTGTYGGVDNVVLGNGDYSDYTDNFANGWLNHFYIYSGLEGARLCAEGDTASTCHVDSDCDTTLGQGDGVCGTSAENEKIRLGVAGMVEYPADSGAALQPMGPTGNDTPFDNVLTFSGDTGTVVYTQMKVLENLPIMLTAPRVWEALGLPLTPFEDTINFFADPGAVDEDKIRPYVAMKAKLVEAICDGDGNCSEGGAVLGSDGKPVIGFGSAPIDIPNCERCHSAPAYKADGVTPNLNSPSYVRRQDGPKPYKGKGGATLEAVVDEEINYWKAYYDINTAAGDTDWYPRLKGAAISIEAMHDYDNGTDFMDKWPVAEGQNPLELPDYKWMTGDPMHPYLVQNTRMGHESVICQKCHADNVIAVVKSATLNDFVVPPISESMHNIHRPESEGGPIVFNDALGTFGGCQGCHPAHRSDGTLDFYPISKGGDNTNEDGDVRLGGGGCFVGRDVHSNPLKDIDGAETPAHLNSVGQWLADNVFYHQGGQPGGTADQRGIWCTNCHTQLSQEIWRQEDCHDLVHGTDPSTSDGKCRNNIRAQSLQGIANQVAGGDLNQVIAWLDPNNLDRNGTGLGDFTMAPWLMTPAKKPVYPDANVATIEVAAVGGPGDCGPLTPVYNAEFNVDVCVSLDDDGDPSVNILSFCTTDDCVAKINAYKSDQSQWRYPANPFKGTGTFAAAVPFRAADDAGDHWLAAGEPHCADCHAPPYVEQSGNLNPFPPFNYPAKASLSRYSRGHQDLSCQACHESIHGLYPVGAAIDNTTYAQAAALNPDGSHGPIKCGACHAVDASGIPQWIGGYNNFGPIAAEINGNFDSAVGWAHKYTAETNVLNTTCQNCHGVNGVFSTGAVDTNSTPAQWTKVLTDNETSGFLVHAMAGFTSRQMMDKAETLVNGTVSGAADGVCTACHTDDHTSELQAEGCDLDDEPTWYQHLTQGRVAESVWEEVSIAETGTRCGW